RPGELHGEGASRTIGLSISFSICECCFRGMDCEPMKIEAITLREIQMPLVHFFETSFKRTFSRQILLLTIHCDGIDGWGECVAGEDPFYSSEWHDSAWATVAGYRPPAITGRERRAGRG